MTDEMVAELRAQLGDAAVVELTAFVAVANMNTRPARREGPGTP